MCSSPRAGLVPKGIFSLLLLDLFLVNGESGLEVVGQRSRMVLGVGVEPEAFGTVAPGLVDRPLEEILAQALTDKIAYQAELHQFNLAFRASVQFGDPCGNSIDH